MKNLIVFLAILICQAFAVNIFACDFDPQTHCPNKPYPYRRCGGLNGCFFDPRNIGGHAWDQVLRSPNKLCLTLGSDDTSPSSFSFVVLPGNSNVFTRDQMINEDFACAQDKWSCVCNDQRPCQAGCEIQVVFINDIREYKAKEQSDELNKFDPNRTIGMGYNEQLRPAQVGDESQCWIDPCFFAIKILINSTVDFQKLDNDGNPTRYYFNRSNYEIFKESAEAWRHIPHTGFARSIQGIDLCDVLTHELGHMYGLDHYEDCPSQYQYDGIMNESQKYEEYGHYFPLRELSNDDICAFKKLYCPQFTPVEEEAYSEGTEKLYPNPVTNTLNVQFELTSGFKEVSFEIVDMGGNTVYRFTDSGIPAGVFTKTIDVSPFPQGAYLIRINSGSQTINKMFEIVK